MRSIRNYLTSLFITAILAVPQSRANPSVNKATLLEEQPILLMEAMGQIMAANQNDCAKMASSLNRFISDNAAKFQAAETEGQHMTPDQKKAFVDKYRARLTAAERLIQQGVSHCGRDPQVEAALSKLQR